nr:hypothetical protein [Campylobacter sp.]
MKFCIFVVSLILAISISGCAVLFSPVATPFSPNNRTVNFKNGVPYYIPYGVKYVLVTDEVLTGLNEYGYDGCNVGDVFWAKTANYDRAIEIIKQGEITQQQEKEAMDILLTQGEFGCSSPMSQAELNYVMQQQQIRAQISQQQAIQNQMAIQNSANSMQQRNMQMQQNMQNFQYTPPTNYAEQTFQKMQQHNQMQQLKQLNRNLEGINDYLRYGY